MSNAHAFQLLCAFAAAFLAGSINSVAGGGTLVSFPALIWLGLPSITANATNTLGIWPGALGSIWGFRREFRRTEKRMRLLVIPSAVGGAAGALLLRATPPGVFDRLIPFLILFATILFVLQGPVQRRLGTVHASVRRSWGWMAMAMTMQLAVGIYGGYFGAGISIMMLSVLGILGMTDILEMNALTSLFSLCINGVAAVLFIAAGMIQWHFVLVMALGAMAGGYGAAGLARRVGRTMVRRFVIVVGCSITVAMFVRVAR